MTSLVAQLTWTERLIFLHLPSIYYFFFGTSSSFFTVSHHFHFYEIQNCFRENNKQSAAWKPWLHTCLRTDFLFMQLLTCDLDLKAKQPQQREKLQTSLATTLNTPRFLFHNQLSFIVGLAARSHQQHPQMDSLFQKHEFGLCCLQSLMSVGHPHCFLQFLVSKKLALSTRISLRPKTAPCQTAVTYF